MAPAVYTVPSVTVPEKATPSVAITKYPEGKLEAAVKVAATVVDVTAPATKAEA